MNKMQVVLPLLFVWLISACSTMTTSPYEEHNNSVNQLTTLPINYSLFPPVENKELNAQNLFFLTQSQQEEFSLLFERKKAEGYQPHKALTEVIQQRLANFTYYGKTYDATTAIRLNKGNCMSLAILTTAYAKSVGLDFSYRKVNTLPIFIQKEDIILSSSHVQTLIYDPDFIADKHLFYFSNPAIVIDYFPSKDNRPGKKLSYGTFLAMYYKNIAASALAEGDLNKSFLYANTAYQFDRKNIETINLLAVIHRRAGDVKTAEAIYEIGLEKGEDSISLLSNYIMLLKTQHRMDEVAILQDKLDQLDDPNPYQWLGEAYTAQSVGNIKQAEIYYRKALEKAPYLNQAYMGLYKIYGQQNKLNMAQAMLIKALEWTYELDERKLYKYKLYNIKQNIAKNH